MSRIRKDLTGKRFGRLVVVGPVGRDKNGVIWLCKCDCGNTRHLNRRPLHSNYTRSCGCLRIEKLCQRCMKHGMSNIPEFHIWRKLHVRCYNPRNTGYKDYGAKGVTVCERWSGENGFIHFFEDMGSRPTPQHSLDRINPFGNYEPGNCRWATALVQASNRRDTRLYTYKDETDTIAGWCRRLNIGRDTLKARLEKGWEFARAVETPVREPRRILTVNGESGTIDYWSKKTGISKGAIQSRLFAGKSDEEALSVPVRPLTRVCEYQGKRMSVVLWAESLGVKPAKIYHLLYQDVPFADIVERILAEK